MLSLQKQKCHTKIFYDLSSCQIKKIPGWGFFYAICIKNIKKNTFLHIFFDKTLDFCKEKHKICINFSSNDVKTVKQK